MSDDKHKAVRLSTPEEGAEIARLRGGLVEWLVGEMRKGTDHRHCVTALALFAASGARSKGVSREDFLYLMGRYYDFYAKTEN